MRWLRREAGAGGGLAAGLFFPRGFVQKSRRRWVVVGAQDSFPSFAWRLTSYDLPVSGVFPTVLSRIIILG